MGGLESGHHKEVIPWIGKGKGDLCGQGASRTWFPEGADAPECSQAAGWVFRLVQAEQEAKFCNACWVKLPCYNRKLKFWLDYTCIITVNYQIFL